MQRVVYFLMAVSCLVFAGCGGKSSQPADGQDGEPDASHTTAGGAGSGAEPECAATPREAHHETVNANTLTMARLAEPSTPLQLFIGLVDVAGADGADKTEKQRLYGPYQDAVQAWLEQRGATEIGRFWSTNSLSATLEARHVAALLCLANVLDVEALDPYYAVVAPPWGPAEAGPSECPLQADGSCPTHCWAVKAQPLVETPNGGCFMSGGQREVVACSRAPFDFDDDELLCGERISTGQRYGFGMRPQPLAPEYLDFRSCQVTASGFCDEG